MAIQEDRWFCFPAQEQADDIAGFIAENLVVTDFDHLLFDHGGHTALVQTLAGNANEVPSEFDNLWGDRPVLLP
jgi:hypothetical protein